jgi:glycosyltransferase involved in cell wall biosynthesis
VSETVGSLCRPLFPEGHIEVIPNWISRLPEQNLKDVDEDGPLLVICAGRLEKYKGVQLLIEAAKGLQGVVINILGDGDYRNQLMQMADSADVRFLGFQKDIDSWFCRADIFVMPSMGPEGLPMVAIEAMSHGLPCIFSDLPVHREITDDGRGALLFCNGDVADLRSKLQLLISCKDERRRIGKYAFELIRSKYSEPAVRAAYLNLFAFAGSPQS